MNVALTLVLADIVIWHVPVPKAPHAPPHPPKVKPVLAEGVSVTTVWSGNPAEHWLLVGLQLIPAGHW